VSHILIELETNKEELTNSIQLKDKERSNIFLETDRTENNLVLEVREQKIITRLSSFKDLVISEFSQLPGGYHHNFHKEG